MSVLHTCRDKRFALEFQREQQQILPSPLDSSVALASVMFGKYGLIRSSIVTVARELKAEEMVLAGQKKDYIEWPVFVDILHIYITLHNIKACSRTEQEHEPGDDGISPSNVISWRLWSETQQQMQQ